MNRRTFLQATLGLALASRALGQTRKLAPVLVDPSRLIRTVVGLRPYRAVGFRVEAEPLGARTVVHNYGHGGAGLTLSWGSARLAVELAWQGPQEYAVLGCGVMGLTTARLLQERGGRVTIYARDLPPHTTSNVAGGQWGPAYVADPKRRTPAFNRQFRRALTDSWRAFQDYLGDLYGLRFLENYYLSEGPPDTERFRENTAYRVYSPADSPFPGYHAVGIQTMMIEPALYLNRLMHDVVAFGGRIEVAEFKTRESLAELRENVLVNCTGLGSRELFGDQELTPIKGQLHILLPQPEIDYAYLGEVGYMFPRRDGILLGGTHELGDYSLEVDRAAQKRIFEGHAGLMRRMSAGTRPSVRRVEVPRPPTITVARGA